MSWSWTASLRLPMHALVSGNSEWLIVTHTIARARRTATVGTANIVHQTRAEAGALLLISPASI